MIDALKKQMCEVLYSDYGADMLSGWAEDNETTYEEVVKQIEAILN